jgi:hypothetical protein
MIEETLKERGKSYGKFIDNATVAQTLKLVLRSGMGWGDMDPDMKEAFDMTCSKMSRAVTGDAYHIDNYIDIQGFNKLVSDRLNEEEEPKPKEWTPGRIMSYSLFNHHNYLVGLSERDMCKMYQEYLDEAQPEPNEDSVPPKPLSLSQWSKDEGYYAHADGTWGHNELKGEHTHTVMQYMHQEYLQNFYANIWP